MKKIIIVIYIILLLIALKLIVTFVTNEVFISKYNNGKYDETDVKSLFVLNFFEPYTAYYNNGNILYYNNDFDGAINSYTKALELSPPEDKERDIRINLELAKKKKEASSDKDNQNADENKEEDIPQNEQAKKDTIEEKLKEIQTESAAERKGSLDDKEKLGKEFTYYSGKKW